MHACVSYYGCSNGVMQGCPSVSRTTRITLQAHTPRSHAPWTPRPPSSAHLSHTTAVHPILASSPSPLLESPSSVRSFRFLRTAKRKPCELIKPARDVSIVRNSLRAAAGVRRKSAIATLSKARQK